MVEGLDNIDWLPKGSFAILTRMHHAAVDGTAAAQLTWALHDLDARGKKRVGRHPGKIRQS
ncbi:wax ester/triacylglycerol synthase domain-containing protein [Spongiibacter pelagi]|uniref:wax ester/triacylglycerol synthase domain-containing protein n=1 Tax=Spongiibacter pelagi TaxID=2760804 RepID=UPI00295A8EF6|nr:wax ester/triacylglycerol synthase domain-containing protein [Spongiibacter pelagi]